MRWSRVCLTVLVTTLSIGSVLPVLRAQGEVDTGAPVRHTIEYAGAQREYFVRLPSDYRPEKTYWLLVTVHGGGGNGQNHFLARGVRRAADEAGLDAIVVSPTFSGADAAASRFPVLGEGQFLKVVITDLCTKYRLHPNILLTGYSRGGQFSHRFAFDNPQLVAAVAPLAAGTWTTPDGALLIDSVGRVDNPESYLSDAGNRPLVPDRLRDLFSTRVAKVAGRVPSPGATEVPFMVMCGSLDSRFAIAQQFADSLRKSGYRVQTEWPKTPHGSKNDPEFRAEFAKYSRSAVAFFLEVTQRR